MSRILLGLLVGILGYLVVKKVGQALGLWPTPPTPLDREGQEPDVLVQDPVCQTYIPRKEALKTEKDGKAYFFCSEGCLKRFRRGGGA
ncbi:MAG: YHS domain-containing protein [Deltaproteobacteria bacterium]|nr:YHS domain-containing protein [Deltaproteobacteria bacterium]